MKPSSPGPAFENIVQSTIADAEITALSVALVDSQEALDDIRAKCLELVANERPSIDELLDVLSDCQSQFEHIRWHCDDAINAITQVFHLAEGRLGG